MYFPYLVAVFVFLIAIVIGISLLFKLRNKHRLIWDQLWTIQKQLRNQEDLTVNLKKRIVAIEQGENLRLPAKLPSQNGEELLVCDYFKFKRDGNFIEVGAYNGLDLSNTYFLEALGWEGILIEPNPELFSKIEHNRPFSEHYNAAVSNQNGETLEFTIVEKYDALSYSSLTESHKKRIDKLDSDLRTVSVPVIKLDDLIPVNGNVDFISIDVEGAELDVLATIDFNRVQPVMFAIEDNSNGKDTVVSQYMAERGYREFDRLGCNIFYTLSEEV